MANYSFFRSTSASSIGTSYDVNKKSTVDMSFSLQDYYLSELNSIQIKLSDLAVSTTAISVKISSDAAGDNIILPDTSASIDRGLTTTTKGSAVIAINAVLYASVENWFIFYKLDAGSGDVDDTILSVKTH